MPERRVFFTKETTENSDCIKIYEAIASYSKLYLLLLFNFFTTILRYNRINFLKE